MTPEERAAAIRQFGFREPTTDWRAAITILVLTGSLLGFGLFGLGLGEDGGMRLRGAAMALVGAPMAIWAWRHYAKPIAPVDDGDFARELRHRFGEDAPKQG